MDFGALLTLAGTASGIIDNAISGFERLRKEAPARKLPVDVAETIISLSSHLADAKVAMAHLEDKIVTLQREAEAFERFEDEKRNYVMTKTPEGELVYRLKDGIETDDIPHEVCPACFKQDKIRILQPRGTILKCLECGADYRNAPDPGPGTVQIGTDYRGY